MSILVNYNSIALKAFLIIYKIKEV